MTRCVRLLSQYALVNLAMPKLNLQTKAGNRSSQHVARNVGYRYLGLVSARQLADDIHDSERFELTAKDFIAANGELGPVVVMTK